MTLRSFATLILFTAATLSTTSSVSAQQADIDVVPVSTNCDWAVAPDGTGIVLSSLDGEPADYMVSISTELGLTTALISVSDAGSYVDQEGTAGISFSAPHVIQREMEIAFALATTSDTSGASANSSFASRSWLDDYSNWFNSTFGSGWSEAAGGVIHSGLTTVMEEETLANTSDGALLTGTVIVSGITAVGIVAGGEVLLGVGTLGGSTTTAGTLTTVSTGAGTVHVSTAGTVATVEVGFVEAITPNLIHTVTQTAVSQGATTAVVNTGPVVATDLAISLGLAAETGAPVLGGTVTLIEGGAYPIFEILIPLL
jgi:hypothetical protein